MRSSPVRPAAVCQPHDPTVAGPISQDKGHRGRTGQQAEPVLPSQDADRNGQRGKDPAPAPALRPSHTFDAKQQHQIAADQERQAGAAAVCPQQDVMQDKHRIACQLQGKQHVFAFALKTSDARRHAGKPGPAAPLPAALPRPLSGFCSVIPRSRSRRRPRC